MDHNWDSLGQKKPPKFNRSWALKSPSAGAKTFESPNLGNYEASINQTNWQLSFSKIWGYESKEGRVLNQMITKEWFGFNKILTLISL